MSRQLVNNYGVIVFEKLNEQGMMQNHHLAKSIGDAAWNQLIQNSMYKAVDDALVFSSSSIWWRSDLPGVDGVVSSINCRGYYFRIAQLAFSILDALYPFQQIVTQAKYE